MTYIWLANCTLLIHIFVYLSANAKTMMVSSDCECGIKNHDSVFMNELEKRKFAENHAWPWMASIVNVTLDDLPEAYCGATVINNKYILTAAHCIPDMMDTGLKNFRIYVGTNYIANETDYMNLGIQEIISHPKFDFDTADNDICLIKLSEPINFSNVIRPICLRQDDTPLVGDSGFITGWGSFNLTEHTENSLKEAEAIVVSNEVCEKNYSSVEIPITDNMICATLNVEEEPCKGDSGGPLLIKEKSKGTYTQIGIISHGQGCAVPDYPSIFSRISPYIDWIKTNTKDGIYCSGTFSS